MSEDLGLGAACAVFFQASLSLIRPYAFGLLVAQLLQARQEFLGEGGSIMNVKAHGVLEYNGYIWHSASSLRMIALSKKLKNLAN